MKLRTLILVFLFLFAMLPLTAVVLISLPLVLEKTETFYHRAHLQNLRADFKDLDQHIASRHEMIRLLARMPETANLLAAPWPMPIEQKHLLSERFDRWANHVIGKQLDIVDVAFIDAQQQIRLQASRDPLSLQLGSTEQGMLAPPKSLIEQAPQAPEGAVLTSPMKINSALADSDPSRFMTVQLLAPVFGNGTDGKQHYLGAAMMLINVSGIAQSYANTWWAHSDGRFLQGPGQTQGNDTAFERFPGLQPLFEQGQLGLWEAPDNRQQILWVPMFRTESGETLWVGRNVDPSPVRNFIHELRLRLFIVVVIAILIVTIFARQIAVRAERLSERLINSTKAILEGQAHDPSAQTGPQEWRSLTTNLAQIASRHAEQTQALKQSNRYKSQFLANVSHELRTPLNSIILLSKALLDERQAELAPKQREQARVIHEAGSILKSLIDNILDLSRIESGRLQFEQQSVDLIALLHERRDLLAPQASDNALELTVTIDPDAPHIIEGDGAKIGQIITNFLSNAVKFTEQGTISLQLKRCESEQTPVCLCVSDTGMGIEPDKLELIFSAFQQADGSTKRRFGGTGLGLSISRQLARAMGGDIQVSSRLGHGSRFCLQLPTQPHENATPSDNHRELGQENPTKPAQDPPENPARLSESLRGMNCLLYSPALDPLLAYSKQLKALELNVLGAQDQDELDDILSDETETIHLIVLILSADDSPPTALTKRLERIHNTPQLTLDAQPHPSASTLAQQIENTLIKAS